MDLIIVQHLGRMRDANATRQRERERERKGQVARSYNRAVSPLRPTAASTAPSTATSTAAPSKRWPQTRFGLTNSTLVPLPHRITIGVAYSRGGFESRESRLSQR